MHGTHALPAYPRSLIVKHGEAGGALEHEERRSVLLGRREGDIQYVVGGGARRRENTRTHVRPVQRALQAERAGRESKRNTSNTHVRASSE